jgi:hypothetical protein
MEFAQDLVQYQVWISVILTHQAMLCLNDVIARM